MPQLHLIPSRLAVPAAVGLLLALGLAGTGCRLTKVHSDLTPLTDDLAERLRGQVRGVLNRTGAGEPGEGPNADNLGAKVAEGDPARSEQDPRSASNFDSLIQGAGFSRNPLSNTGPNSPADPSNRIPGRLTLPDIGNVPDMARRLIPTLRPLPPLPLLPTLRPLWPGGAPQEATTESQADSALGQLIDSAQAHVNQLGPGTTPEQNRKYVRNQVNLRLLSLIGDRPEVALEPIPGIDNAEKEFLQKLVWAQVNYFDLSSMPESRKRATATIEQLDAAIRILQPRADLKLRHLALCRQIQKFGDYEPFEKNSFSPGQDVLLYVEIENAASRPTGDGRLETLLKSVITIREAAPEGQGDGRIVHQIPIGVTPDICRTTRRDYFHNYKFEFPRTLPLGRYVLSLTLTDLHGNKQASESLRFVLR
jgi:hypothetical protein